MSSHRSMKSDSVLPQNEVCPNSFLQLRTLCCVSSGTWITGQDCTSDFWAKVATLEFRGKKEKFVRAKEDYYIYMYKY